MLTPSRTIEPYGGRSVRSVLTWNALLLFERLTEKIRFGDGSAQFLFVRVGGEVVLRPQQAGRGTNNERLTEWIVSAEDTHSYFIYKEFTWVYLRRISHAFEIQYLTLFRIYMNMYMHAICTQTLTGYS